MINSMSCETASLRMIEIEVFLAWEVEAREFSSDLEGDVKSLRLPISTSNGYIICMPSNVQQNGSLMFRLEECFHNMRYKHDIENLRCIFNVFQVPYINFPCANFFVGPKDHRTSTAWVPGKLYRSVCGCRCCRPRITAPIRMTQSQRHGMTIPRESPLVTSPIFACPSGQPMVLEYAHQHLPKRPKSPSFVR